MVVMHLIRRRAGGQGMKGSMETSPVLYPVIGLRRREGGLSGAGGTPVVKTVDVNISCRQPNNADENEELYYVCIS